MSRIVAGGDKQGVKDTLFDKCKMVMMVLSIGKWVQVEHIVVDTERLERILYGLSSHFHHSVCWKFFFVEPPIPKD